MTSLLDRGYLYAIAHGRCGGAGGRRWWLQGAVYSMAPGRWRAVVAEVPFVDVVNSMLDPTIPLTTTEWDEWGDPRDPATRAYMESYSPYDNVPAGDRPDLLVTGSLHDPRVLVHEPAKWVARLRATAAAGGVASPDGRGRGGRVLFRPELGAGAHVGPAGRYDKLAYEAEILAFILDAGERPRSRAHPGSSPRSTG